ncbi:RNA cytidine acetyltransferase 1 [Camellia lanceoleosa]|uniref:RNA cytidine acetyltransferase 1 n=1 Tax=Camellia lanceoleosa TaxID=1840588 RepID=A0ACC0F8D4_9ERIC|nr:RNA cytidine acetyltransferase 1 [Camellia lanceoleosa]
MASGFWVWYISNLREKKMIDERVREIETDVMADQRLHWERNERKGTQKEDTTAKRRLRFSTRRGEAKPCRSMSSMRKKVDERITTLIENGVKTRHRSMFVIIGDKSRDQIVNLHYMLSKADIKSRPTVLWCYKEKLELSSHKRKRTKQLKKLMQRGLLDPEKVDAFSLFLESRDVSYCFYGESDRILGNTYGMCVLQDFEALTPNILARTMETVEGGGLVVLLLHSLSSLSSLCTMVMDIHERFRTESHSEIVPRFNERFLLSLASCTTCLVVDDELNILPISSHVMSMTVSSIIEGCDSRPGAEQELFSDIGKNPSVFRRFIDGFCCVDSTTLIPESFGSVQGVVLWSCSESLDASI